MGASLIVTFKHRSDLQNVNDDRGRTASYPTAPLTDPGEPNYRTGLFKTARFAHGISLITKKHEVCVVWLIQNI